MDDDDEQRNVAARDWRVVPELHERERGEDTSEPATSTTDTEIRIVHNRSPSRPRGRSPGPAPGYASEGRSPSPSAWSIYDIDSDDGDEPRRPDEPLPQEWTQPHAVLEDGTVTEFIVAQSIEQRTSKSGSDSIVLVCPSRPPPSSGSTSHERTNKPQPPFRWLHVQHKTFNHDINHILQTLEKFVLNCPYISARVRVTALLLLRTCVATKKDGWIGFQSTILPSTTRQDHYIDLAATQVLFLGPLGEDRSCTRTLLKAARGYDVGIERELSQVARKMGVGGGRDVLHSVDMWSLSLGPGVLITGCCLPSADIRGNSIKIDDRAGRGFYAVPVKRYNSESCCTIVVDPDCSYVDFLQHAVAAATSGARSQDAIKYDLFYEAHTSEDTTGKLKRLEFLTPLKWLKLLASHGVESHTFHLMPQPRVRSRSRRPYHRRCSPATNRRRGDRESPARPAALPGPVRRPLSRVITEKRPERAAPVGDEDEHLSGPPRPIQADTRDVRHESPPDHSIREQPRYDSDSIDKPTEGRQETPPADASGGITVAPFFAWRVKSGKQAMSGDPSDGTAPETENTIQNVFRILSKINESLLSSESGIGEAYSQAYKCTEENLLTRHPHLARELLRGPTVVNIPPPAMGESADQTEESLDQGKNRDGEAQPSAPAPLDPGQAAGDASQGKEAAQRQETGPSTPSQNGAQGPAGRSAAVTIMNPADIFSKHLLEISQSIIRRFLPQDEHSVYHAVCERFWGSVDEAIRQVRWSAELSSALWTIRDFDVMTSTGTGGVATKVSYAECATCCSSTAKYPSASEALEHLHTVHIECPLGESAAGGTRDRPHDDPCYVYIKSLADISSNEAESIMEKEFLDELSDFSSTLNNLQWLVATNSPGNAQRRQARPGFDQPSTTATLQPQLPRSLVYAFDELVAYYVVNDKRLSIQNREVGLRMRNALPESAQALKRSARLASRARTTCGHVQRYLQQARRDIILSRGGADTDTALGTQALDTASFGRVLLFSAASSTFSAPLAQKHAATAARIGAGRAPGWNAIEMYREYSKHLHAEAARRPRRRLFLDIHAFDDELEALEELLERNTDHIKRLLNNFPDADEHEPFTYYHWKRRYREMRAMRLERVSLMRLQLELLTKLDEVQTLQKVASALALRVRQQIEIMDEDHGKAIRVFTIVTVLFLPMTFVSGFLGMNTVDIRDTEATQSLYWTVAIPVTVVVLSVAFVYGYKGDEIGDWIHDRIRLWNTPPLPRPAKARAETRKSPLIPTTDDGRRRVRWTGADVGADSTWRAARDSVLRRDRRSDLEAMRRSTFQSDVLY